MYVGSLGGRCTSWRSEISKSRSTSNVPLHLCGQEERISAVDPNLGHKITVVPSCAVQFAPTILRPSNTLCSTLASVHTPRPTAATTTAEPSASSTGNKKPGSFYSPDDQISKSPRREPANLRKEPKKPVTSNPTATRHPCTTQPSAAQRTA